MVQAKTRKTGRNKRTAVLLFSLAGGMVGLAFASVPLYQLFCQVTGYGGTPNTAELKTVPLSDKTITVQFDANVNRDLPWRFRPAQREVRVRGGEPTEIAYLAKNNSDGPITGTATFNVTPYKAGPYFSKVDCFCFTEQLLKPGEQASLPVTFYVDPEIFTDPNTRDVKNITLSYTFFRAEKEAEANPKAKEIAKSSSAGGTGNKS